MVVRAGITAAIDGALVVDRVRAVVRALERFANSVLTDVDMADVLREVDHLRSCRLLRP